MSSPSVSSPAPSVLLLAPSRQQQPYEFVVNPHVRGHWSEELDIPYAYFYLYFQSFVGKVVVDRPKEISDWVRRMRAVMGAVYPVRGRVQAVAEEIVAQGGASLRWAPGDLHGRAMTSSGHFF